jgi:hypothetical protein
MNKKTWTERQLREAAEKARSVRQILKELGLKQAGGNYAQIKKYLEIYKIDLSNIKGRGWKKGLRGLDTPRISLDKILVKNSDFQSHKLKKRLFSIGLKSIKCEECGWAKKSDDGRIPLELDHINGDRRDNRLDNLRVLCPNCHSLKPTHRGRNRTK